MNIRNDLITDEVSLYWKTRPVFMSSTFQDMHMERDYLRDNAFKRLAELLKERCVFLEIIDLRQGVDIAKTQSVLKREMEVIKVCLDEIGRSKPFIIAILGDRYGYIPMASRSKLNAFGAPSCIPTGTRR